MLIVMGGLPGTGKSTLAVHLAQELRAVYLRIDTIEQAMRDVGLAVSGPEGYLVARSVAEDNLRLGHTVIADSVNPIGITRGYWRDLAGRTGRRCVEIEVVCSDVDEHRRRVESRVPDIPGHQLPTWQEVVDREYEAWEGAVVMDTAGQTPEESARALVERIGPLLKAE